MLNTKVPILISISNSFSNKIAHANEWMRKKIPTCSNSALDQPKYFDEKVNVFCPF